MTQIPSDVLSRACGCLIGLATGDAVGTTLEFKQRGSFTPINDMVGGGPFGLGAGQWTDDTSMALCLAASLLETGRFDAVDQMRRYCRWRDEGYMSSNGRCFDIGNTVGASLQKFSVEGEPFAGSTDPHSAGNGSIMRLAPIVLFCHPDREKAALYAEASSRTTHGATECLDACRLLAVILCRALDGESKEEVALGSRESFSGEPAIQAIACGSFTTKPIDEIRGSGYVVESLEAALWCFWQTESFEEAILRAANLGDDADTTAAVCGQIAGAYYGEDGIPEHWLDRLVMWDEIGDMAERLCRSRPSS